MQVKLLRSLQNLLQNQNLKNIESYKTNYSVLTLTDSITIAYYQLILIQI